MTKTTVKRPSFSAKRDTIKPKSVSLTELVKTRPIWENESLPLVVEPIHPDVDLYSWTRSNRERMEDWVAQYGGVLFRGFRGIRGAADFDRWVVESGIPLMKYMEGATPRRKMGDGVYTSTDFPADQMIALHNELSYVQTWPRRIIFHCVTAPPVGGETPIADVRKVYNDIDPEIRARFEEKGWMLIRNFGLGFGPEWRKSFHVETQAELDAYAAAAEVEVEWLTPERLRTRQIRPAVTRHPSTGEKLWFNHLVFWHLSSLSKEQREVLERDFKEDELPYNTYYGDGTPITDEVVAHIKEVYDRHTIKFRWQEGDVLLLDNMFVAHGRSAFEGERLILATMGTAISRSELPAGY